jgi:hypothetical protein
MICLTDKEEIEYAKRSIIQIVHDTEGHIAVYGPVCHTQYIIWTDAKCHELFVMLYTTETNFNQNAI